MWNPGSRPDSTIPQEAWIDSDLLCTLDQHIKLPFILTLNINNPAVNSDYLLLQVFKKKKTNLKMPVSTTRAQLVNSLPPSACSRSSAASSCWCPRGWGQTVPPWLRRTACHPPGSAAETCNWRRRPQRTSWPTSPLHLGNSKKETRTCTHAQKHRRLSSGQDREQ